MQQWGYKATKSKLDRAGTAMLANRGFLCRSSREDGKVWADHVRNIAFGDVVNVYFIDKGTPEVGAYEIVRREEHPRAEAFRPEPVPGTALYAVVDPSLVTDIDTGGAFEPDAELGLFTGWLIKRHGRAIPYDAKAFRGQSTLVRLG